MPPESVELRVYLAELARNRCLFRTTVHTTRLMATSPRIKVARGLLLYGQESASGTLDRGQFMKAIEVRNTSFRDAGSGLGATGEPGLRFFDSKLRSHLRFGPGAGLMIGMSIGTSSLCAALVDANGTVHHKYASEPFPLQLELSPGALLDRIRHAAGDVLARGLKDENLLVDGALPFLGLAVGWSVPLDREKRPMGEVLRNRVWHNGVPLYQRVAEHLHIQRGRSHAINGAHAAAIAVAWDQTRDPDHRDQRYPRMAIVMRLAGEISGASIIVEPPQMAHRLGPTSGFPKSILLGGADMHAGELGHVPVDTAIIAARNEDRPEGLAALTAYCCACTHPADPAPEHLEAYAAAPALAHRLAPGKAPCDVVRKVVAAPNTKIHNKVLRDVGVLVGHALLGPVAMLNPATITLTGSLAVETVRRAMTGCLAEAQPFGAHPEIVLLSDDQNRFIRSQGAALAILRDKVHRNFESLLSGRSEAVCDRVRDLTEPLTKLPWE